jgi:N-acetylmuramic acid 6-phosphate etherase
VGSGSALDDVEVILGAHADVMPLVGDQAEAISRAVTALVDGLSSGGRLVYVGAGTSGWLAALDAAEVVTTFGLTGRVESIVGGGLTLDPVSMTLGDDDLSSVVTDPRIAACGAADVVIAVSASGSTPFTVAAVARLRDHGVRVVAIVNRDASPLHQLADVVIAVPVQDEVVSGSSRLTAGMAQKVILNTLSTAAMVRFGRTVAGQMVCVLPLNEKLRARIVTALALAAGVDADAAAEALAAAGDRGDVAAVSLIAGVDVDEAQRRLVRSLGSIAAAIGGA